MSEQAQHAAQAAIPAVGKKQRQVSMVLDLNKCLGCHTCSIACKKMWNTDAGTDYAYWNSVETMPGKGSPAN